MHTHISLNIELLLLCITSLNMSTANFMRMTCWTIADSRSSFWHLWQKCAATNDDDNCSWLLRLCAPVALPSLRPWFERLAEYCWTSTVWNLEFGETVPPVFHAYTSELEPVIVLFEAHKFDKASNCIPPTSHVCSFSLLRSWGSRSRSRAGWPAACPPARPPLPSASVLYY